MTQAVIVLCEGLYYMLGKIKEEFVPRRPGLNKKRNAIVMPSSTMHLMKQPRAQQINQVDINNS